MRCALGLFFAGLALDETFDGAAVGFRGEESPFFDTHVSRCVSSLVDQFCFQVQFDASFSVQVATGSFALDLSRFFGIAVCHLASTVFVL